MQSANSREVIRAEDLLPAPEAAQRELEAIAFRQGTRISTYELERLVDQGVDLIRHYVHYPKYGDERPGQHMNFLHAIFRNGSPDLVRRVLSESDLSKFQFSGRLGEQILAGLLKGSSPAIVWEVISSGFRVDDFSLGILDKNVPAPVMKDFDCRRTDYRTLIDESSVLSMVDALCSAGDLVRPDVVFMALMERQKRLRPGMPQLLAYVCGGLDAGWLNGHERRRLSLYLSQVIGGSVKYLAEMAVFGFPQHRVGPCQSPETSGAAVYTQVASKSDKELAPLLLECGYGLDEANAAGRTILAEAVRRDDLDVVKLLIARGADLGVVDSKGASLLHLAVQNAGLRVVEALHRAGAPVNLRDQMGWTPLAGGSNGAKYLAYLCGRSIPEGDTLAMLAVRDDWPELLQQALDKGDDICALSDTGKGVRESALRHHACDPDVWRLMASSGVDIDEPLAREGEDESPSPLLHIVSANNGEIQRAMVRSMVCAGGNVDVLDGRGRTALHLAIRSGHREMVELLLELGADSTIKHGKVSTLQMTKDPEMKRLLSSWRTGRIISGAMGGNDLPPGSSASDSLTL